MSQFPPQSMSEVQLQGQPPQSDIQSHQQQRHLHQLHPHANQNLNLNAMMNPGASIPTPQGSVQGLTTMQDPNLDPKLSGLNEQPKIGLSNLLPSNVDPKLAQLDIRSLNPKDLLQLLKQIPLLQVSLFAAKTWCSSDNASLGERCRKKKSKFHIDVSQSNIRLSRVYDITQTTHRWTFYPSQHSAPTLRYTRTRTRTRTCRSLAYNSGFSSMCINILRIDSRLISVL